MTNHDVDERLQQHADRWRAKDFAAPPIDPMLEVAVGRRSRGRWLAVAASLLVVASVAAVPLLRGAADHAKPVTAAQPSPIPSSIVQGGKTLGYVGEEQWSDPVLDESDPRVVWVYASVTGGPVCRVTPVAQVSTETANSVSVVVATYAAETPTPSSGTQIACTDDLPAPARLKVVLQAPLGSRTLIDAFTDEPRTVLDPATVLKPSYLPDGYTAGPVTWDAKVAGAAMRTYEGPGGNTFTVTVGPASVNKPIQNVIDHVTVRGHPATVSVDSGFAQDILIAWSEDATHAVAVYQMSAYDPSHPALSAAELEQVANSLQ
jgi:hypothetical protein